jgi:nucleoside-diphosphate-sugar epimerase
MPSGASSIGILGATGFLGRRLVGRLSPRPDVALRLFGRRESEVAGHRVRPWPAAPSDLEGLDVLVHLSGITSSRAPEAALAAANVHLPMETARAAASVGVPRFVFVGSLHAHAKASETAIRPTSPFRPVDSYGRSKRDAELALRQIAAARPMQLAILRPPMIYGPGGTGSFAQLAALIRRGLPIPLGLASQPRSFCSVENAASAVEHLIFTDGPQDVLLPADPEDLTPRSLALAIGRELGRDVHSLPVPKSLLAAPLALVGRSAIVTSLFEPLCIDRGHWETVRWRPVQTGAEGMRQALSSSP